MDQGTVTALAVIIFVVYPCVICCFVMIGPRRAVVYLCTYDTYWPDDSAFVNVLGWSMPGPMTAHVIVSIAHEIINPSESTVAPSAIMVAGTV